MAAATGSTHAPANTLDVASLVQSLPACLRCRQCRRGCDTLLPKCHQCTKAGVECLFTDHGKGEVLPRSHIANLINHLRALTAHPSPASSGVAASPIELAPPVVKAESVASEQPAQPTEHYFTQTQGTYRYVGGRSCLVTSPRLRFQEVDHVTSESEDDPVTEDQVSEQNHRALLKTYFKCVHPLYPIVDHGSRFLSPVPKAELNTWENFCRLMVYSIACHIKVHSWTSKQPNPLWAGLGDTAFRRATKQGLLEASTMETSIDTLRAVLLLAINSLFDPKRGNVGQQVALAARLVLDLEQQDLAKEDSEALNNMHMTIFSIENELASTLDRPATFPEPIGELYFHPNYPTHYLCSLYRLQNRFRNGDTSARDQLPEARPRQMKDKKEGIMCLSPALELALHQTHLLLNPESASAMHLLESVVQTDMVYTFLTPHWVYRAATVIYEQQADLRSESRDAYRCLSNAQIMLERVIGRCRYGSSCQKMLDDVRNLRDKYRWDERSSKPASQLRHLNNGDMPDRQTGLLLQRRFE